MSQDFELPDEVAERVRSVRAMTPLTRHDVDSAWNLLSAQMPSEDARNQRREARAWNRWTTRVATLGSITFAVALAWQFGIRHNPESNSTKYTTYTTKAGQRASITLAEGSHVVLGPASVLQVKSAQVDNTGSGNGSVEVDIDGEALFSINHAAQRPFTVTAHGVVTRVLGTEFVVRAYDRSQIRVAVRDGRVSVQSRALTPNNAAIVNAGEAVSVAPSAAPTVTPISDLATDFSWANGELVLRDVPLGEAMLRLSRWYGMEFRASDTALLGIRVEGTFPSGFSRSRIQSLAHVVGARAEQSGKIVTFSAVR